MTSFIVDPPPTLLPPNYGQMCGATHDAQLQSTVMPATFERSKIEPDENIKVIDLGKSKNARLEDAGSSSAASVPSKTTPLGSGTAPPLILANLTVKELREQCRQRGLKTTGKREEVEKRLSEALAGAVARS